MHPMITAGKAERLAPVTIRVHSAPTTHGKWSPVGFHHSLDADRGCVFITVPDGNWEVSVIVSIRVFVLRCTTRSGAAGTRFTVSVAHGSANFFSVFVSWSIPLSMTLPDQSFSCVSCARMQVSKCAGACRLMDGNKHQRE